MEAGSATEAKSMAESEPTVALKRVYDEPAPDDGTRVLVERLWPRGLSKDRAHVDLWLKEVAPSNELRRWYGHDPARWQAFRRRYESELADGSAGAALARLRELARQGPLTLVFSARDATLSNAVVLRDLVAKDRQ
jgi:uncharacterized protein YeaO (DUF488 family)